MKRLVTLITLCTLLFTAAQGEIPSFIGRTDDGEGFIYRSAAPDGQDLIYTTLCEEGFTHEEDVNFDGIPDLVVLSRLGASNAGYLFFVSTEDGYLMTTTPDELFNYQLDADNGLVLTSVVEGWAGELCRYGVYQWNEEDQLTLIRYGLSTLAEDKPDTLHMQVIGVAPDGMESILWEARVPSMATDAVRVELETMQEVLRTGTLGQQTY